MYEVYWRIRDTGERGKKTFDDAEKVEAQAFYKEIRDDRKKYSVGGIMRITEYERNN